MEQNDFRKDKFCNDKYTALTLHRSKGMVELTFDSSSRPVAASGPQEWNTYSVLLTLDEFMDHRLVRKAVFRKHFILLCPLTEEEWYITQRDVIEMLSQMVPKEWCNRREGQ